MRCRHCGGEMIESKKSWSCKNCGLVVWKEIGRRAITRQVVEELMRNGRTKVMEFKTKEGKPFAAALVVKNGKVEYEYVKKNDDRTVEVRVEAGSSGRCYLSIRGVVAKQAEVNFGLVSATEAECLALITAARYVAHCNTNPCRIKVSLNNLNLARYLLRERTPRDRKMRLLVEEARKALDRAGRWEAELRQEKRPRLKGGPLAETFPAGIFPWLEMKIDRENGRLVVDLPDDPAVRAQFKAAMYTSTVNEKGLFVLPEAAEKAVKAWINKVRGGE